MAEASASVLESNVTEPICIFQLMDWYTMAQLPDLSVHLRTETFPHTRFRVELTVQTENKPIEQMQLLEENSEPLGGSEISPAAGMSGDYVGGVTDQTEVEDFIGFEGISSALVSVATSQTWSLGGLIQRSIPKLFWVPGQNDIVETTASPLLPSDNDDQERVTTETLKEESQDYNMKGLCESKYLDVFPLYQHLCLYSLRADINWMSGSSLSELVTAECLTGLRSPPVLYVRNNVVTRHLSLTREDLCSSWQDLPEVKKRGLVNTLSHREICLQEAMFEMISSEASYLKRLGVAVNHFLASEALEQTIPRMEHHILFSNLCSVRKANEAFLLDLEVCLGENAMISRVEDVVLCHSPAFRSVYVPYLTNMMYQEALVTLLMQENREFLFALKKLESDPVCQRQTLKSFLVLPFQRITRLKIILENILKLTERGCESIPCLKEAIEATHKIVMECNDGVQRMKQMEELVYLHKLIDFGSVKSIPLVTSGRYLIHEGLLKQLIPEGYVPGSRISYMDIYLHVFNDLLLISLKKEQRFSVLDHAVFPTHVHIEQLNTEALGLPPESFVMRLSQNHTGHATAFILAPHTIIRSDKEAWMKALSSQRPW